VKHWTGADYENSLCPCQQRLLPGDMRAILPCRWLATAEDIEADLEHASRYASKGCPMCDGRGFYHSKHTDEDTLCPCVRDAWDFGPWSFARWHAAQYGGDWEAFAIGRGLHRGIF